MTLDKSVNELLPWIKAKVTALDKQFPGFDWGTYPGHDPTEARATDAMVPNWSTSAGRAKGQALADALWARRKELNIWYIIFNERIISQTRPAAGWIKYTPTAAAVRKSEASAKHWNHVHTSFYANDPGGTEAPVGTVWLDVLVPGVKNSVSWRLIQRALGVTETGEPDAATIAAAKTYQASLGDDVDGWLGPKQLTRLFADKKMAVTIRTDASGQAPKPTTPPKPTEPEKPTVTATVRSVFNNPLWNNDSRGGGWGKRCAPLVKQYLALKPDVISVCEIDPSQAADIAKQLGDGWAYWRVVGGSKYGPLAIFWRQATLERAGDAAEHEFSDNDSRYLLSLPLKHKASGETFWVDVTHLENDGDKDTDGAARRKIQATELAKRTTNGKRIGGGDLNSTTLASGANGDKPRVIMGKAGLKFMTSQPSAKVENRGYASHHSTLTARPKGAWIDDQWWRGVTFVKGGLALTSYSDHHILWADYQL